MEVVDDVVVEMEEVVVVIQGGLLGVLE